MMQKVMKGKRMCDCPSIKRTGTSSANCTHPCLEHLGNAYYKCMSCGKLIDKWNVKQYNPQPCEKCEYRTEYERKQSVCQETTDKITNEVIDEL
jgi:DNA-directed RNA polymerase subunit RPC12/RpoP